MWPVLHTSKAPLIFNLNHQPARGREKAIMDSSEAHNISHYIFFELVKAQKKVPSAHVTPRIGAVLDRGERIEREKSIPS